MRAGFPTSTDPHRQQRETHQAYGDRVTGLVDRRVQRFVQRQRQPGQDDEFVAPVASDPEPDQAPDHQPTDPRPDPCRSNSDGWSGPQPKQRVEDVGTPGRPRPGTRRGRRIKNPHRRQRRVMRAKDGTIRSETQHGRSLFMAKLDKSTMSPPSSVCGGAKGQSEMQRGLSPRLRLDGWANSRPASHR